MKHDGTSRAFGDTPEPQEPQDGVQATEKEQSEYDLVVSRALTFIHDKGRDQVLQSMAAAETPAQGIGKVTASVIRSIKDSAKNGGREIDSEILYNAGAEIAEDLSLLAQKEGVYQFSNEEEAQQETEDSLLWAVKFYGDEAMAKGEIDAEQQASAKQMMQEQISKENPTAPVTRGVRDAVEPKPKGIIAGPMMNKGV